MEKMLSVRNELYSRLLLEAEQLLHNGVQTGSLAEKFLMDSTKERGLSHDEIMFVYSPSFHVRVTRLLTHNLLEAWAWS
jgi:hypothetical protein